MASRKGADTPHPTNRNHNGLIVKLIVLANELIKVSITPDFACIGAFSLILDPLYEMAIRCVDPWIRASSSWACLLMALQRPGS